MAKPFVAEVNHHIKELDYAKQLVNKIPKEGASVGLELPEAEIAKHKMILKQRGFGKPIFHMTGIDLFWNGIIRECDEKGISVVPLIDEHVTEMVGEFNKKTRDFFDRKRQAGKINEKVIDGAAIEERNVDRGLNLVALWNHLSPSERDSLTISAGKMVLETERQLMESIPKKKPTLSFVGVSHGDALHDVAEVIPFPEERMNEMDKRQVVFLRKSRTGMHAARKRMEARSASQQRPKPKRKKQKNRRRK